MPKGRNFKACSEEAVPESADLPAESAPSPGNKAATKKKSLRIIIVTVFIIMCAAGGISWYLLYGNPDVLDKTADKIENDVIGMYGSTKSYIYYPIDYDLDITTVPEYMSLDRSIHYTSGAETVALTDENIDSYGDDVKFFVMYFYYAVNGDYESYNSLFTDSYYEKNEEYYSFTQQMIYDINIEKLSANTQNGVTTHGYNVSYKIYRNNGTFRNDIGSDGSKTLYFELVEKDSNILINRITYYK